MGVANSVIFIDEFSPLFKLKGFENILLNSDNYFVILCRKDLKSLPISINEEYTLVERKYDNISKIENIMLPINSEEDYYDSIPWH